MINANAPCKDCQDEVFPSCYSTCERYAAFKEDLEKRKAAVKAAKELSYDIISGLPKSVSRQIGKGKKAEH